MLYRRAALPALAAVLLTVAPHTGAAGPPSGRYQARPAAVLACGGFVGVCDHRVLEGWIDLTETDAGPRIAASELRFVGPQAAQPFPPADTLPLDELTPGFENGRWVLSGEADGGSKARFEILLPSFGPAGSLLVTGIYFEGCCDRYEYDLGYLLFERLEDGAPTPLGLLGDRFRVEVEWRDHQGGEGYGVPVPLGDRSARFWFFRADNPELLVKVVPACTPFGHNWFFAAGLTDVEVTIRVTDTTTGGEKTYRNALGHAFEPIQDTGGFPCE